MKKTTTIILLLISSIAFSQSQDRATKLTAVDTRTVKIHNKQSCPTKYYVYYDNTPGVSTVDVPADSSLEYHIPNCATVYVTPVTNCESILPAPKTVHLCPCSALPVVFSSLDANRSAKGINLLWTVGDQTGVKEYIIMTSTDGKTFTPSYTVPVKQENNYLFNFKQ